MNHTEEIYRGNILKPTRLRVEPLKLIVKKNTK